MKYYVKCKQIIQIKIGTVLKTSVLFLTYFTKGKLKNYLKCVGQCWICSRN